MQAKSEDAVVLRLPERKRILVIDDEPAIGALIGRVLESSFDITTVLSGEAALELLRRDTEFAVIFCDLLIPDMNGFQIHQRVRELNLGIDNRFVFLSGGLDFPGTREMLAALPNMCIEKPFSLKQITRAVDIQIA